MHESLHDPERNAYVILHDTCAQAIEQKRFRPEITDPDMVAQILWSTLHGIVSLRIAKHHQSFVPWKDLDGDGASRRWTSSSADLLRETSS